MDATTGRKLVANLPGKEKERCIREGRERSAGSIMGDERRVRASAGIKQLSPLITSAATHPHPSQSISPLSPSSSSSFSSSSSSASRHHYQYPQHHHSFQVTIITSAPAPATVTGYIVHSL
ncbi:hypothetical protein E2C01_037764 [Portunus trituberculatus]|uniref:Uncharacterized protein n=1 Tax=Portunus trituberculatus TaxID=210409 RepID=A0A5B7F8Z2_PORTR|nr:hypothetical protein [Portunus trituberculatus]